jgi:hypothetical protein
VAKPMTEIVTDNHNLSAQAAKKRIDTEAHCRVQTGIAVTAGGYK